MKDNVNVSGIFGRMMAHTFGKVSAKHGEQAVHRLFFELYDRTFAFLDREFGFEAVEAFWNSIADTQLGGLEDLKMTKGFQGMAEYWRATLGQEDANYEMTVTDDSFELRVKRCPPTEWSKANNLAKYARYCEHCRVLYSRVGDRCGFAMEYFPPDEAAGVCCGFRFAKKVSK